MLLAATENQLKLINMEMYCLTEWQCGFNTKVSGLVNPATQVSQQGSRFCLYTSLSIQLVLSQGYFSS